MDIVNRNPLELQVEVHDKMQRKEVLRESVRRFPGQMLFSYNRRTGEIKAVVAQREVLFNIYGKETARTRVQTEKDCLYLQALNKKNAIKKLRRWGYLSYQ